MNLPSHISGGQSSHDVILFNSVQRLSASPLVKDKSGETTVDVNGDEALKAPPLPLLDKADSDQSKQDDQRTVKQEKLDSGISTPICGEGVPLRNVTEDEQREADAAPNASSNDEKRKRGCFGRFTAQAKQALVRHLKFIGPGIIASVGYTDPGNWVTDLAAGSQFGYALLFVVLFSGLVGIFLQILAVRMGVVTGHDLARNTRLWLLPDDDGQFETRRNPASERASLVRHRNVRIVVLWTLYLVSEAALVATELAELLGSAIALNLLFPGLPLYGGVLVTCADVMLILFVYKPQGNFRILELFIASLVFIVLGCYIALLVRVKPDWADVFHGYVPSSTLVQPEALYAGIGIIGAVIMPHALYLGSHFSTINRMKKKKERERDLYELDEESRQTPTQSAPWHQRTVATLRSTIAHRFPTVDAHLRHRDANNASSSSPSSAGPQFSTIARSTSTRSDRKRAFRRMTIAEMKLHLPHAEWDIALSLFFFAITVNSAILIVAAAAFYYGTGSRDLSDLYDAFNLLRDTLGKTYSVLFAIGLLAAGQSASITCTLSGQIVSEGFINWRTNPFVRRTITRIITMIPAVAMAIGVGRKGLDQMLIASQVTLSFALPFVLVPLIVITSMKSKMRVEDDLDEEAGPTTNVVVVRSTEERPTDAVDVVSPTSADAIAIAPPTPKDVNTRSRTTKVIAQQRPTASSDVERPYVRYDFTNHWIVASFGAAVYLVILLADMYTLVTTIRGK